MFANNRARLTGCLPLLAAIIGTSACQKWVPLQPLNLGLERRDPGLAVAAEGSRIRKSGSRTANRLPAGPKESVGAVLEPRMH